METTSQVLEGVKLGVGAWSWGDKLLWGYGRDYGEAEVRQAFQACLENDIFFFDTAEGYGSGRSETLLGRFLQETATPIKVATKYMPFPWRLGRRSLIHSLEASLKRLNRQQVELYQIHHPSPPVQINTWMEAMAEAVQRGLTIAVGVSNFDRSQTQQAYDVLIREGVPLASNQMEYSLLHRKIEKDGLLKHCQELGVALIAYSPLAMGALTGKYSQENPMNGFRGRRYSKDLLVRAQPLFNEIKKIGSNHGGKTVAQVSLNWVICKGAIPIPGAKNAQQAEQNAGALGWRLSEEEVARLDELSDRVLQKG